MNIAATKAFKLIDPSDDSIASYRHQILLNLLENKDGLCIDSLADKLSISRNAVQQHFRILEKEGYIKKHCQQKTNGRPLTLYILTDAGIDCFPKQYQGFSSVLMQELRNEMGTEALEKYLAKLGTNLAKNYSVHFFNKTKVEQTAVMVEIMQSLGFYAKQVDNPESQTPDIHAYNCIYHEVAQQFQEICSFDTAFIAELLTSKNGKEIKLHSCMAKGDGACCFAIKDK